MGRMFSIAIEIFHFRNPDNFLTDQFTYDGLRPQGQLENLRGHCKNYFKQHRTALRLYVVHVFVSCSSVFMEI